MCVWLRACQLDELERINHLIKGEDAAAVVPGELAIGTPSLLLL
jgi:hypothetical protein